MKGSHILFCLGTRPEVIKMASLIKEVQAHPLLKALVVNTEQQKELSKSTLSFFNIKPDYALDIMKENQTLPQLQARLLMSLNMIVQQENPSVVVVQGDTMTAFCGALVAFYNHIPIAHIEAGLRSYNLREPFPEEGLRQMISRLATWHFCPTIEDQDSLIKENITQGLYVVGNTVIDSLLSITDEQLKIARARLEKMNIIFNDKSVLVTVHRRENHGVRLQEILHALKRLGERFPDHQFVCPVHPNPNVNKFVREQLSSLSNFILTDGFSYPELVCLMKAAKLILTDSGGIQEEALSFSCPVLVLRYKTERMAGVRAKMVKLVGTKEENIFNEAVQILNLPKEATRLSLGNNPYGNGNSAAKIISILQESIIK